jgi:hypothetical protein
MCHQHFHRPLQDQWRQSWPMCQVSSFFSSPSHMHAGCEIIHVLQLLASGNRCKLGWTRFGLAQMVETDLAHP